MTIKFLAQVVTRTEKCIAIGWQKNQTAAQMNAVLIWRINDPLTTPKDKNIDEI